MRERGRAGGRALGALSRPKRGTSLLWAHLGPEAGRQRQLRSGKLPGTSGKLPGKLLGAPGKLPGTRGKLPGAPGKLPGALGRLPGTSEFSHSR